jgi:mersacidin/lichenicidin family type 2 lantibiotic
MSTADIIRAWKDPQFRAGLTADELALLPEHPAGLVELDDAFLDGVAGGQRAPGTCSLGSSCWRCTLWEGCSL